MSRWAQMVQDPSLLQQLSEVYGPQFPIEVRYFLCQWFEEKDWDEIDVDNPHYEPRAQELLKDLLMQLHSKTGVLVGDDFFLIRMRLEQTYTLFENTYQNNAMGFVRVIKQCIDKEKQIFMQSQQEEAQLMAEGEDEEQMHQNVVGQKILAELNELNKKTSETEKKLKEMQNKQERFIIQYQENVKLASQIQSLQNQAQNRDRIEKEMALRKQKELVEAALSQQAQHLLHLRIELAQLFMDAIASLQRVQKQVLDEELISWKRRQQLAGNGLHIDPNSLDILQQWCELLAELIWNIRQQIKKTNILRAQLPIDLPPGQRDLLPEMNDIITGLLSSLVTSTFIVENQPPQVLKKESRFSATVRLLVGGKLNVHMNPPQVKATIISEYQAKSLLRSDMKAKGETSGEILNNVGTMEYNQGTGQLNIHFRNMQLKRIKRSDKKGSEAVTEEKFCILFQSDFNVGGNDLVFQVWTLSLPVVVTVHGNQECNALATVLWDNAFSEPGRIPFVVPESVQWIHLGEQLNLKFLAATGRGLTEDNLNYLASKIYGQRQDYIGCTITWAMFNKETLKERNFTFWEWFHAVLKLTKEHLKKPWCDGSIVGFVSKLQAQEWLNQKPIGTFLLRFSDSECGGITIAWIAESNTHQDEREVWNLAPFSTRDFAIRGLADRIKDLGNLITLYPDIPKDVAFSQYYQVAQEIQAPANGYIRPHLVNVISMPISAVMTYDVDARTPLNSNQPLSPATSTLPPTPQQNYPDDLHMDDYSGMDSLTDILPTATDYDNSDIEHLNINVNQLLTNYNFPVSYTSAT